MSVCECACVYVYMCICVYVDTYMIMQGWQRGAIFGPYDPHLTVQGHRCIEGSHWST